MKRTIHLIALLLVASATPEASGQSPSARLQQAHHLELVSGDLQAAVDVYRDVSESAATPRQYVADALFRLGRSLEQMGDAAAALEAYSRIVSEFGDQAATFRMAQERLADLDRSEVGVQSSLPRDYELLLSELPPFNPNLPPVYDFSADGSQLVFVAPAQPARKRLFPRLFREIYVQDLAAGTAPRPLVDDVGEWEFLGVPRLSPDGTHLYFTASGAPGDSTRNGAFISDLRSGTRVRIDAVESRSDAVWLPDGRSLAVRDDRDVVVVDLRGREMGRFDDVLLRLSTLGDISPDGRTLVYHRVGDADGLNQDLDLFTLDLGTGERTRLTTRNGRDAWPVWDHDGKSILFASDRDGALNLYRMSPSGSVTRLTKYTNSDALYPMRLGSGDLAFALSNTSWSVMLSETVAPDEARMVVRGRTGVLSPDGSAMVYLDESRSEMRRIDLASGESSTLLHGEFSLGYGRPGWVSPDFSRVAVFVTEGDDTVLYAVSTDGGTPRRMYTAEGRQGIVAAWSPDGSELAFTDHGRMMVLSADGGRPESIAEVTEWEGWSLAWSPDGTRIAAFAYAEGESENHVVVVDRRTGAISRVTPPEESAYKEILDWHPDGRRISYMYYGGGRTNGSRIVDTETGEIESLPDLPDPMWDYIGTWGPDGRYWFSATVRGTGNGWGTFALDPETREFETIRYDEGRGSWVTSWSDDGRLMTLTDDTRTRQLWRLTNY